MRCRKQAVAGLVIALIGFSPVIRGFADTLRLGTHTLSVEVASTPSAQHTGLMYRTELGADAGMLFVYTDSQRRNFWMKNTYIPLSVGFFDAERRLVEIVNLDPPRSVMQIKPPQTVSKHPARYALEVRQGWFEDHGVALGTVFELQPE